jgi:hypothetical protein
MDELPAKPARMTSVDTLHRQATWMSAFAARIRFHKYDLKASQRQLLARRPVTATVEELDTTRSKNVGGVKSD